MATTRRTFTPEFKAEAVRLVSEQGKSLAEVARDLDLGESMLRAGWIPKKSHAAIVSFCSED